MEKLDKDILGLVALKLEVREIFNFSLTNKKHFNLIWDNNTFWINKNLQSFNLSVETRETREVYKRETLKRRVCKYIMVRGAYAGERCTYPVLADDWTKGCYKYCKNCLKKTVVQQMLKR